MPGQIKYNVGFRIISGVLTALYFFRLLVLSHKNVWAAKRTFDVIGLLQKKLLVYIKVSKGIKLAGTTPQIRRPDVTRQMPHIADFSATCIGGATVVATSYCSMYLIYDEL